MILKVSWWNIVKLQSTDNRRSLLVFAFSIFGRINKSAYDFMRKMSKQNCSALSVVLCIVAAFYTFNFAHLCEQIRNDFHRYRSLADWSYKLYFCFHDNEPS